MHHYGLKGTSMVPTEMNYAQRSKNLSLLQINCSENWSDPFCNCEFPEETRWKKPTKKILECNCGEDTSRRLDWTWDKDLSLEAAVTGPEVIFHPIYSQGTTIVSGNVPLEQGRHHYWEVKILTPLSGTDTMIGIGNYNVNPYRHQFSFVSALGIDDQSYGYSYRGLAQHNGQLKYYGKKFSRGRIIGVYLDLFHGTLEFFLNRRSLGRAYANIPTKNSKQIFYPMVSSTSAKTRIRLINAASFENNLRLNCMKVICKYPKLLEQVKKIPGLKKFTQDLWFLQLPEPKWAGEFERNNLHLADEAVLCGKKRNLSERIGADLSSVLSDDAESNGLEINSEAQMYDNLLENAMCNDTTEKSSTRTNESTSDDDEMAVMLTKEFFCDH